MTLVGINIIYLFSIIINIFFTVLQVGYPNLTPSELGVANEEVQDIAVLSAKEANVDSVIEDNQIYNGK